MEIFVLSRSRAVQYCDTPHKRPSVMVSICTPYEEYDGHEIHISSQNNIKKILHLEFYDCEYGALERGAVKEYELMTDDDAIHVVTFCKTAIEQYGDIDIIVHCDAGISRSAGVAAAIMQYYLGDDSEIFDSGMYRPNMWCYRKTMNAFEKGAE